MAPSIALRAPSRPVPGWRRYHGRFVRPDRRHRGEPLAGTFLALLHDSQEQLFQGDGRMIDLVHLAAVAREDLFDLPDHIVVRAATSATASRRAPAAGRRLFPAASIRPRTGWRSGRRRPERRPAGGCTSRPSCPAPSARRIRSFISRVPIGSRPLVGSSSSTRSGSLISAWASPIRRVMPLEYSLSCRRRAPVQADHLDQRVGPLPAGGGGHVEQAAVKVERFFGVQEAVQVRLFRQVADPLVFLDVGGGPAEDRDFPFGRERAAPAAASWSSFCRNRWVPAVRRPRPVPTSSDREFRARTFFRPQKSR